MDRLQIAECHTRHTAILANYKKINFSEEELRHALSSFDINIDKLLPLIQSSSGHLVLTGSRISSALFHTGCSTELDITCSAHYWSNLFGCDIQPPAFMTQYKYSADVTYDSRSVSQTIDFTHAQHTIQFSRAAENKSNVEIIDASDINVCRVLYYDGYIWYHPSCDTIHNTMIVSPQREHLYETVLRVKKYTEYGFTQVAERTFTTSDVFCDLMFYTAERKFYIPRGVLVYRCERVMHDCNTAPFKPLTVYDLRKVPEIRSCHIHQYLSWTTGLIEHLWLADHNTFGLYLLLTYLGETGRIMHRIEHRLNEHNAGLDNEHT